MSCISGRVLWNLSSMGTLLFTTFSWGPLQTQDTLFLWSRRAGCGTLETYRISLRQEENSAFPPGQLQDQHRHTRQGTRCSLSMGVIPVKCSKRSWRHTHFHESWWGKAVACLVCTTPSQADPRFGPQTLQQHWLLGSWEVDTAPQGWDISYPDTGIQALWQLRM